MENVMPDQIVRFCIQQLLFVVFILVDILARTVINADFVILVFCNITNINNKPHEQEPDLFVHFTTLLQDVRAE
jgi:hypothetical protein